jgi:hypothetical protein
MTGDLAIFTLLIWLGFVAVVAVITAVVEHYNGIDNSAWESATRAIPWFTLFMGVHIGGTLLPVNIALGKTRRDFSIETVLFLVTYSFFTAILATLGWLLERVFFAIMDWPQALNEEHLFGDAHDYPRIFIESWLILLAWTAGGVFIAAAYYRYDNNGLIAIAPCLVLSGVLQASIGAGSTWGPVTPLVDRIFGTSTPSVIVAVLTGLVCFGAILAMAWSVIRDMPMRSKSA